MSCLDEWKTFIETKHPKLKNIVLHQKIIDWAKEIASAKPTADTIFQLDSRFVSLANVATTKEKKSTGSGNGLTSEPLGSKSYRSTQ